MKKHAKIIVTIIFTIIPVILTILIGVYSYKRYEKGYFIDNFLLKEKEANEIELMTKYLKYETVKFEEKDVLVKEVLNEENKRYCTLRVRRAYVSFKEEVSESGKKSFVNKNEVICFFYLTDIDEVLLNKKIKDENGDPFDEKDITKTQFSLKLIYSKNLGINYTINFNDPYPLNSTASKESYPMIESTTVPKENKDGKKFNFAMRVALFIGDSKKGKLSDLVNGKKEGNAFLRLTIGSKNIDILNGNKDDKDCFEFKDLAEREQELNAIMGANRNVYKIGYSKYVFGKYAWWQCLVAFVVSSIFSFGFLASILAAEKELKNKKEKK